MDGNMNYKNENFRTKFLGKTMARVALLSPIFLSFYPIHKAEASNLKIVRSLIAEKLDKKQESTKLPPLVEALNNPTILKKHHDAITITGTGKTDDKYEDTKTLIPNDGNGRRNEGDTKRDREMVDLEGFYELKKLIKPTITPKKSEATTTDNIVIEDIDVDTVSPASNESFSPSIQTNEWTEDINETKDVGSEIDYIDPRTYSDGLKEKVSGLFRGMMEYAKNHSETDISYIKRLRRDIGMIKVDSIDFLNRLKAEASTSIRFLLNNWDIHINDTTKGMSDKQAKEVINLFRKLSTGLSSLLNCSDELISLNIKYEEREKELREKKAKEQEDANELMLAKAQVACMPDDFKKAKEFAESVLLEMMNKINPENKNPTRADNGDCPLKMIQILDEAAEQLWRDDKNSRHLLHKKFKLARAKLSKISTQFNLEIQYREGHPDTHMPEEDLIKHAECVVKCIENCRTFMEYMKDENIIDIYLDKSNNGPFEIDRKTLENNIELLDKNGDVSLLLLITYNIHALLNYFDQDKLKNLTLSLSRGAGGEGSESGFTITRHGRSNMTAREKALDALRILLELNTHALILAMNFVPLDKNASQIIPPIDFLDYNSKFIKDGYTLEPSQYCPLKFMMPQLAIRMIFLPNSLDPRTKNLIYLWADDLVEKMKASLNDAKKVPSGKGKNKKTKAKVKNIIPLRKKATDKK